MSYEVIITQRAKKDIRKLDRVVKKKLRKYLERFSKAPFGNSKKLVGSKQGSYRYRIGNYRVIFDIVRNKIIILRVGHRREIYH